MRKSEESTEVTNLANDCRHYPVYVRGVVTYSREEN